MRLRLRRRTWAGAAILATVSAALALLDVRIADPRVAVRWEATVEPAARAAVERRYDLRNGEPDEGTTWQYDLADPSPENLRALIQDPAVADTANIDRDTLATPGRELRVGWRLSWFPFSDVLDRPAQLLGLHPSLWLLIAGGVLIRTAGAASQSFRRNAAIITLTLLGMVALILPIDPSFVTMGEAQEHAASRTEFERYFGGRARFEKHLTQVSLIKVYERLEPTERAPAQALVAVSRAATVWFVFCAIATGILDRWSPVVLRYLALSLLAPSALLYFGWREFGYLSLNLAVFPLLARGLRDGGPGLEAGSALAGFGAALHGAGVVSLLGTWIAVLGARAARFVDRVAGALRAVAWGTAAYVGWVAIYVIILKLPIDIDRGAAGVDPWRPWFADDVRQGRVSVAMLSAAGARDVLMSLWVVGAPLLAVALSLWRRFPHEVRAALWYAPASVLFVVFRWPFQGLSGGMDLVFAGFPALYALAWVCAHDERRTNVAALLLLSAHYAFWRIVLDPRFEIPTVG